jgi:hypothetical protein
MSFNFVRTSSQRLTTAAAPASPYPLTISAWIKSNSATTSQSIANAGVSASNVRYLLALTALGEVIAFSDQGGQASAITTNKITANNWHHAAGVFLSRSSRTAYLDGTSGNANTALVGAPTSLNYVSVASAFAGGNWRGHFDGQIAEVGIWNAALTQPEIASLAKGMTCDKIRPQSLVFYAPLVRDLIDTKGGLTITNNNGATVANHPKVYV